MSLWTNFTDSLKGVAKGFAQGGLAGGINSTVSEIGKELLLPAAKVVGSGLAKSASGVMQGFQAAGYAPGAGPSGIIAKAGTQIASQRAFQQLAPTSSGELTARAQNAMTDITTERVGTRVNQLDPLLQTAVAANQYVFDPLVKKPIGTAALDRKSVV